MDLPSDEQGVIEAPMFLTGLWKRHRAAFGLLLVAVVGVIFFATSTNLEAQAIDAMTPFSSTRTVGHP